MRLKCPERRFEEKQAFEKEFFFKAHWEPEREIVRLCRKFFDMVFEAAFYISANSFWISCMFFRDQNWFFLRNSRRKNWAVSRKFRQGRKCCMLRSKRSILRKFFFRGKVCFITFGPWRENSVPPVEHLSTTLRKLYITCPEKKYNFLSKLRSLSLSKTESKKFGRLANIFRQVYQNCILHV